MNCKRYLGISRQKKERAISPCGYCLAQSSSSSGLFARNVSLSVSCRWVRQRWGKKRRLKSKTNSQMSSISNKTRLSSTTWKMSLGSTMTLSPIKWEKADLSPCQSSSRTKKSLNSSRSICAKRCSNLISNKEHLLSTFLRRPLSSRWRDLKSLHWISPRMGSN